MRVLIDTDIFVDYLREYAPAKDVFQGLLKGKFIGYSSVISEAELLSGKDCGDLVRRRQTIDLIDATNRVIVNSEIASKAAEFRRMFSVPLMDSLIAATAYKLKAKLYTRNTKHYQKIVDLNYKKPYE